MRLSPVAACAAALAIVAAGCGGVQAGAPGAADGAATVVPANAVAFVAASTDLSSARWHGLGALALQRLPKAWGADLEQLAAGELDVAVLPGQKAVAFVQPQDASKLAAFAAQHGAKLRKVGDWTAVAADASTLDTVAQATTHLADNTLWLEAMHRLPADALVRAYVNGSQAEQLFASIPGQLESQLLPPGASYRLKPERPGTRSVGAVGVQQFRWLAAALTSSKAGLELRGFAPTGDLAAPVPPRAAIRPIEPYRSALVDEIPAGALAVLDFQVPQGAFELLSQLPAAVTQALGPAATLLPIQLDALLGGETALYVRPGLPMPEVTLVTQPADTTAASQALDQVLAELPPGSPLAGLKLYRATIGGQFVVSTTQQGIDDLRGGGAKLSADPAFLAAKRQSGLPDLTTGFAYLAAKDLLPLAGLAGVKLPAGLPQPSSVVVFGARANGESTFTAFVGLPSS